MKVKNYKKTIILLTTSLIFISGIAYVGALNGWWGGGGSVPSDTFSRGLVGYWNMDEGGGQAAKDLSGNGNNGTLGANSSAGADDPVWGKGKNGGGLKFDGKDDYADAGNGASLNITNDLTLEAWVQPISASQTAGIAAKSTSTDANIPYVLYMQSSNFHAGIGGGGSYQNKINGLTTIIAGGWYHVVLTVSGTTESLYVNGVKDATDVTFQGTRQTTGYPFEIGRYYFGGLYFNGSIDDIRIYNRALSAAEVKYHYNRGGPVAEWKFEEGSGQKAFDSTENNNDGWLGGTSSAEASDPTWTTGKYGGALSFDGANDYVNISDSNSLDFTSAVTVTGWVYYNGLPSQDTIAGKGRDGGTNYNLYSGNTSGHTAMFYVMASGGNGYRNIIGTTSLQTGVWYHIAGSYDGAGNIKLYVNGKSEGNSGTGTGTGSMTANNDPLQIGAFALSNGTDAYFFNGSIDEVKIYNYARAADEIRLDYNSGLAAHFGPAGKTCAEDPASCVNNGLVGYWNMEEGGGQTAKDLSNNGNNGTLGAAATAGADDPLWTKGKKGNALKFDGKDDYISSNFQFSIFNFQSISQFINFQTLAAGKPIIGKWGNSQNSLLLKTNDTNSDELKICVASGLTDNCTIYGITSDANIAANMWYNIQVIYDGTQSAADRLKLYLNGVQKTLAITGTIPATLQNSSGALEIGGDSDLASYASAKIDDIRIYNRALSAAEINYLYNEKKPIGQWDLDEGSGATAHDSQSNLDISFPATESERPAWSKP